ncbi:UNVERIFIED_CONTAM: Protein of unknown function (DUF2974) [Acetivibrio alkalicellulosi]
MSKEKKEMDKSNELNINHDIESKALEGRLLNTLIYLNIEWTDAQDGRELEKIVRDLGMFYDDKNGYARYQEQYLRDSRNMGRMDNDSTTGYSEGSRKDFEERQRQYRVIKAAIERDARENNGRLGSMTIANQSWNMGYDKKGLNACTFEDSDGNIMVVYRGTGSGEWGDNGEGLAGLSTETQQQRQAVEYFDYIMKRNGYHQKDIEIILTGHSKGGNKAQFTTINSIYRDFITNCFSYDGQGFSPEAIAEFEKIDNYEELIQKLYSFNGQNDFVNPLGHYIIPNENRFYYQTAIPMEVPSNINNFNDLVELFKNIKDIGDFKKFHFPDSILTEDGRFSEPIDQGFLSLFVEKFAEQALTLSPGYRDKIFSTIMGLMQGSNETVNGESVFTKDDVIATLISIPLLVDFAGASVLYATREKHGILAEYAVALMLVKICPHLFWDDLLKITARNMVDGFKFAIDKLKDFGELIIRKIEQFGNFIKDIGESLGRWFGRFMAETKEAFGKLVAYARDFGDRIINGVKSAAYTATVAIENFKNKITTVVSNFFNNLVNGVKNFVDFCKRTVVKTWNSVVESVNRGIDRVIDTGKTIVRNSYETLKRGVNEVIDFSKKVGNGIINFSKRAVTEAIKGIGLVVEVIQLAGEKIKQFGIRIGQTFLKFVSETKKALVKAKDFVIGTVNNVKNAVQNGVKVIEAFKEKAQRAISNFITSIANGVKNFVNYCKKAVSAAWDKVAKKASQTVDSIVDKTKEQIQKKYEDFKNGVKYVVDYKKEAIKKFGEKSSIVIENFKRKVIGTIGKSSISKLKTSLNRLEQMRKRLKNLEIEFGERVNQILSDANKITSEAGRKYSESYVRQRVSSINKICEDIRSRNRRVCEIISRKTKALQYAFENYKKVEMMIRRDVKAVR